MYYAILQHVLHYTGPPSLPEAQATCLSQDADDLIPACAALLSPEESARLRSFCHTVCARTTNLLEQLSEWRRAALRQLLAAEGRRTSAEPAIKNNFIKYKVADLGGARYYCGVTRKVYSMRDSAEPTTMV